MSGDEITQILTAIAQLREAVIATQVAGQLALDRLAERITVIEIKGVARDLEFEERTRTLVDQANHLIVAARHCAARMKCLVDNPTAQNHDGDK